MAVSESCCLFVPVSQAFGPQGSREDKRLMEQEKMAFSTENVVAY
jgi:hypothetical protein